MILTCLAPGLLQETAPATVLKVKTLFCCFLYVLMLVVPRMGLVVPFCVIPFTPFILFLVFLFCSVY